MGVLVWMLRCVSVRIGVYDIRAGVHVHACEAWGMSEWELGCMSVEAGVCFQ